MKKQVGLLIPQTNLMVENDMFRIMATNKNFFKEFNIHFSRIKIETRYKENKIGYLEEVYDNMLESIKLFGTLNIDVFGFMCTSSIVHKINKNIQIHKEINGKPLLNPVNSIISFINDYFLEKTLIISPYNQEYTNLLELQIIKNTTGKVKSLSLSTDYNLPSFTNDKIIKAVDEFFSVDSSFDLIYIPCTNFDSLEATSFLERKYKNCYVVNSNQITLFYILSALGINNSFKTKYGKMFLKK